MAGQTSRRRRHAVALGAAVAPTLALSAAGAQAPADATVQLRGIAVSVQEVDLRWTPAVASDGCNVSVWRDGATIAVLCGAVDSFVDASVPNAVSVSAYSSGV
jgi:hypothetical protein